MKALSLLILLIISLSFATESPVISFKDTAPFIADVEFSQSNSEITSTGILLFDPPNILFKIEDQKIIIRNDTLYIFDDNVLLKNGYLGWSSLFTSDVSLDSLLIGYDVKQQIDGDITQLSGISVEDEYLMGFEIHYCHEDVTPRFLKLEFINGVINKYKIKSIRFGEIDDNEFEIDSF